MSPSDRAEKTDGPRFRAPDGFEDPLGEDEGPYVEVDPDRLERWMNGEADPWLDELAAK